MSNIKDFQPKALATAVATAALLSSHSLITAAAETAATLEEIVVTATRRSQSVQDIPFNISAVTGQSIEAAGIVDSTELLRAIPGIVVADGGARAAETNNNISIRGLNIDPNSTDRLFLSDPTVSTYVDNTPTFSNFILRDINRVEVLRGPQGTLYGSGSLGGTVRYIMNKPDPAAFSAKIGSFYSETEGSDGHNFGVDGVLNIPVNDQMAVRLSAGEIDNDGVVDYVNAYATDSRGIPLAENGDIVSGAPIITNKKDADTVEIWYARASFLFEPSDDLTIQLSYQQQSGEYGGRRQVTTGLNGYGEEYDDYEIGSVILEPASNDTKFGSLEIEYDLGFATLSSSTSYYDNAREGVSDNTGFYAARGWLVYYGYGNNPRLALAAERENSERALVQELRLVSSGDDNKIDWAAGVYYMDQSGSARQESNFLGFNEWNAVFGYSFYNPADNSSFTWTYDREFEDLAFFGEMTFHLTDDVDLTLGARRFDNEDKVTSSTSFPIFFIYNPTVTETEKDNDILLKGNIAWEFSDTAMVYGTISEGYRRGGTNAVPVRPDLSYPNDPEWSSFDSDNVLNYEIGLKGQTDSISYTLSIFYVDWSDPQLNVSTTSGAYYAVSNGDSAETQGVEVEFNWAATDTIRISGGYAYVDASLTDDLLTYDSSELTVGKTELQGEDGAQLPGTPEHSVNLTISHTAALSSGLELISRIDGYYQSETENSILNLNPQWQETLDGFSLWGVSATLISSHWTASLFVKNLFNEEGTTATFKEEFMSSDPANGFFGTGQKDFISNPRTIGISGSYKF